MRLSALPGRTGHGVRVAVIDSGVHASHPHVQGVAGGVGIDAAGQISDDFVDRLGHGTAVAAVIREKAPSADIYAVKVFDRDLATTGDALVAAMQWARAQSVQIINLSLGTANPAHETALSQEVDATLGAGTLIVAAGRDRSTRWLPGSLPGVVAVTLDVGLDRDACEIAIADDETVTIRAAGYPRPIPGVPPERNLRGVSFSVANATGLLARLFEGLPPGTTIQAALGRLKSTSPSG